MIVKVVCAGSNYFSGLYQKDEGEYLVGVDILIKKGLKIDLAIGDFDSSTTVKNIKKYSHNVVQYSSEKDESDLELALSYISSPNFKVDYLAKKTIQKIIIYNATGKRLDHYHAVINLLIRYTHFPIEIVDKYNQITIVNSKTVFKKSNYKYISFFAVVPDTVISLKGFKYPLFNFNLGVNCNIGLSNEIVDEEAILETNNKKIIVIRSN